MRSFDFSSWQSVLTTLIGIAIFVAIVLIMPNLLLRSLRFRAVNTSWSGLRFGFDGDRLYFDYTLKPGVATTTNALHVLAMEGIEVRGEDQSTA